MGIPLRVLLVEDSEDDAELVLLRLEKDGYDVTHERVQTAVDLKAALVGKTWDVVISDHFMPGFISTEALAIVKASGVDLPFIIVSGAIGEDVAVAAMRAGADDFLLKDRLARLAPAIERELRETDERQARKEAEASARQLAAIVESSDDAIIGITLEGTITSWNAGAERIFGYASEEVTGRPIFILVPPERQMEESEMLDRLVRGERVAHFETVRLGKNNRRVDISLTLSPIRDDFGTIIGASKIGRDISEQKRIRETLKEANRRKDEFLAMLAHELRNPLASIGNATQIFGMLAPPIPSLRQAQEMSERQMRHLTRLVDDLLDVSRITLGKITLANGPANINEAIMAAIDINRHLIESKHHRLETQLMISPSASIEGDATRLAQIFGNLLNNAAKYTEDGGTISILAQDEGNEVVVRIKDSGIGIAADILPGIFDLFTQADRSLDRAQGGLGIGLSLAKSLVELHGGSVDVYSEGSGKGSEFVVRLPVLSTSVEFAMSPLIENITNDSKSIRVLVVDDNADSVDSMAVLLELQGYQVSKAQAGLEALDIARKFCPHIVLLDIGLPGMDGFEVARQMRKIPETQGAFIIALTGYGQADDFKRSRDAGFDYHLVKPVELSVLKKVILEKPINAVMASH